MKTIFNVRPKGLNVGNDAIAQAMQNFIYEASGELVNIVSIPATQKYDGGGLYGLTKKSIHEINQYGSGVIVGGGNLYENGELDVDIEALDALERPLMVFSVSVGRIYNSELELTRRTDTISDAKLLAVSKRADINLLRDSASVEWVRRLGADADLGGCPTIFLNEIVDRLPGLTSIGKKYSDYTILSIRNPELMNIPPKLKVRVRKEIESLLQYFRDCGERVALLCHDSRDISFASGYEAPYIYTGDVLAYLSLIYNCKLLVSYRLHSFLPALSFDTPAVKISYDERALSLIHDLGYGDWNINCVEQAGTVEAVVDRISRIARLEALKNKNKERWARGRNVISAGFKRFDELMKDG